MENNDNWLLKKYEEDAVFGPVSLEQLREWAYSAQISPMDRVSNNDGTTWIRAPMVPELDMDWLVEVTADHLYGPTTLGAVQEFMDAEEVHDETRIINCVDGTSTKIGDISHIEYEEFEEEIVEEEQLELQEDDEEPLVKEEHQETPAPVRTSIRVSLQQKVRDLEASLLDERRALQIAEESYRRLEARYEALRQEFIDATGQEPSR